MGHDESATHSLFTIVEWCFWLTTVMLLLGPILFVLSRVFKFGEKIILRTRSEGKQALLRMPWQVFLVFTGLCGSTWMFMVFAYSFLEPEGHEGLSLAETKILQVEHAALRYFWGAAASLCLTVPLGSNGSWLGLLRMRKGLG